MNWLSSLFARRYLLSKKSHSVINIISRVSSFAVGVPVAAMVILLSVFNGFEDIVKQMYTDFDPDIAISAKEGKVFGVDSLDREGIVQLDFVEQISEVLEDNAMLEYSGRQYIATVRGVDSLYSQVVPIEKMVAIGEYQLKRGDYQQALLGQGLAYNLGARVGMGLSEPLRILAPRRGSFSTLLPIDIYRERVVWPEGMFELDAETDSKYALVTLEVAREVFDYLDAATSLMVKLKEGTKPERAKREIANLIGDDYKVLTRYEQQASIYRIMTYEKYGIFLITLMVLIIASFSIVGSLVMLIIDKQKDIGTIITMGGSVKFVRDIFVKEGMLISAIGAVGGMVFGLLLCLLQIEFGFIKIPADTFLVNSYPVVVKISDLIAITVAFTVVSYIITKLTAMRTVPKSDIRITK